MKKAMALILTLAMVISLAACGGSGSSSTPPASGAASGGVASAAGKEKILMGLAMHNQAAEDVYKRQEVYHAGKVGADGGMLLDRLRQDVYKRQGQCGGKRFPGPPAAQGRRDPVGQDVPGRQGAVRQL